MNDLTVVYLWDTDDRVALEVENDAREIESTIRLTGAMGPYESLEEMAGMFYDRLIDSQTARDTLRAELSATAAERDTLARAARRVLAISSSHQFYDKDGAGLLRHALREANQPERVKGE